MVIDLAQLDWDVEGVARRLRSRVCIVGGGIAGLFLAQQLAAMALDVTLLEAGGGDSSPAGASEDERDPFGAELVGRAHAGTGRGRVCGLGGCSHTWGGQLLALPEDAIWPIPHAELAAAAERVLVLLGLRGAAGAQGALPFGLQADYGLQGRFSSFLPFSERNFTRTLGKTLSTLAHVTIGLHAPVVELVLTPMGDQIAGARVRRPDGTTLLVEADHFVLAAGTVETCRLLLASRGSAPDGVGNGYGQVGLHFHDHVTVAAATFRGPARERVLAEMRPTVQRVGTRRYSMRSLKLEASPALRKELELLPAMAHLTIDEPESVGAGALRQLLRARQRGTATAAVQASVRMLPRVAAHGSRLVWQAYAHRRRYVSAQAGLFLQLNVAQDARSSGRVLLSDAVDRGGMPRAVVDWCIGAAELGSLRRFAGLLRGLMEAADVVHHVEWLPALFSEGEVSDRELLACIDDARHAMGGACMGIDPRRSAVDPALRVHGVANLSVASAAVFPDGSAQLPTLTLMALCLRLAGRLHGELR